MTGRWGEACIARFSVSPSTPPTPSPGSPRTPARSLPRSGTSPRPATSPTSRPAAPSAPPRRFKLADLLPRLHPGGEPNLPAPRPGLATILKQASPGLTRWAKSSRGGGPSEDAAQFIGALGSLERITGRGVKATHAVDEDYPATVCFLNSINEARSPNHPLSISPPPPGRRPR